MNKEKPFIAVLLTCFNRKDTTLGTLASLQAAADGACRMQVVLVDDGSTDGTAEAVMQAFPQAHALKGEGNLYWNQGMRRAWLEAQTYHPDFYMWLNDDTPLRPRAIADLLTMYQNAPSPKTIVTGCTVDPKTKEITYGGYRHVEGGLSRLRFRHLRKGETDCHTMNGNCVLFPSCAVQDIGINSEHYRHASGDVDYGLRAKRAGYAILQHPDPVAEQEKNLKYQESVSRLTIKNWRFILTHPKGIPLKEWFHFCKNFGGPIWPLNFIWRYIKIMRI